MAANLSMPERMAFRKIVKKCTQSATAKVRIIVGAEADGGVNLYPSHPAVPMPIKIERIITNNVENVPEILRKKNN